MLSKFVSCVNFKISIISITILTGVLFYCTCMCQDIDDVMLEDAKELLPAKPYHWKEWCIVRGKDCLYFWSEASALELSNGSNGWFRFILDGKLQTMYSSGSPENGSDSSGWYI